MIVKKRFPNLLFCNSVLSELYEPKKNQTNKKPRFDVVCQSRCRCVPTWPCWWARDTQQRQILPWSHTDCTPFPGPWASIYKPARTPERHALYFSPPITVPPSPVIHLCVYHDSLIVTGPVWPFFFVLFCSSSFVCVFWLAGFFSCVNGFVLSDTCERARLWLLFLQLCLPLNPLIWASLCLVKRFCPSEFSLFTL